MNTTSRLAPSAATRPAALAAALTVAMSLLGCESVAPTAAPGTGAATAAQAHQRLIDAYNACNEAAFVGAYAPLFSFVTSTTRQAVTTRESLQRYLGAACANRPNPTMTLLQQTTRVSGAITVFVGQYRFKVPVGAAAGGAAGGAGGASPAQFAEVVQNFTVVMERMGERWLVLAQHVSVAP